jgi:hypothetical protein
MMDAVDGVESRAGGATNEREAGGTTNKKETRRGRARVRETNERGEERTKERVRLSSSLN